MSQPTGIGVSEFTEYGGVIGSAMPGQVEMSMRLAWGAVEGHIGTQLYPAPVTETHPWPDNGRLVLNLSDVIAIQTVTAVHDEGLCDCVATEFTGCAFVADATLGVVNVRECYSMLCGSPCGCSVDGAGTMVRITYTAAVPQPISEEIKFALVLVAKGFLKRLTEGDSDISGLQVVSSWHSMDYGENYVDPDKVANPFTAASDALMAKQLLSPWPRRRAIGIARPRSPRIL